MIEQFYLTHIWDSNRYYHSESWVDLKVMAMKGYSTLWKWSPTIRCNFESYQGYLIFEVKKGLTYLQVFDGAKIRLGEICIELFTSIIQAMRK